ncbi:phytoene/squalene synthase family protein [Spirosoma sp. KCTC 42546]|uniref:phytoene/squalene synthase family protein n=1 Tax=Spirosoma sp. KCTC 42546 TaxID=2520506 RepID=UPI0011597C80|nr:phytoene/squalene synthase family protein [Spirosoma sp. KCTC 42546]QDK82903.1 phytoene/squalene synthase family protein [Spirosoma sp. KCTC 42546]
MMALFNKTALECSKLITERYSTSFTLGIKTLDRKFHFPIYAIYGFVRYADEIVDTFHDYDKKTLLERFKHDAYQAIDEGISLNPVLQSFQLVVREYKIEHELIEAFLKSMEMDLYCQEYDTDGYSEYIYGSAEVVGLMCLRVFCEGNSTEFNRLCEPARKLGAAFQKVNFLRDMKSDFVERGRTYFPGVDFSNFGCDVKQVIEDDIQRDFDEAYIGILNLPRGARMGVYLAYMYYQTLFNKIKQLPASRIQNERVRVPNPQKFALLAQTYLKYRLNVI